MGQPMPRLPTYTRQFTLALIERWLLGQDGLQDLAVVFADKAKQLGNSPCVLGNDIPQEQLHQHLMNAVWSSSGPDEAANAGYQQVRNNIAQAISMMAGQIAEHMGASLAPSGAMLNLLQLPSFPPMPPALSSGQQGVLLAAGSSPFQPPSALQTEKPHQQASPDDEPQCGAGLECQTVQTTPSCTAQPKARHDSNQGPQDQHEAQDQPDKPDQPDQPILDRQQSQNLDQGPCKPAASEACTAPMTGDTLDADQPMLSPHTTQPCSMSEQPCQPPAQGTAPAASTAVQAAMEEDSPESAAHPPPSSQPDTADQHPASPAGPAADPPGTAVSAVGAGRSNPFSSAVQLPTSHASPQPQQLPLLDTACGSGQFTVSHLLSADTDAGDHLPSPSSHRSASPSATASQQPSAREASAAADTAAKPPAAHISPNKAIVAAVLDGTKADPVQPRLRDTSHRGDARRGRSPSSRSSHSSPSSRRSSSHSDDSHSRSGGRPGSRPRSTSPSRSPRRSPARRPCTSGEGAGQDRGRRDLRSSPEGRLRGRPTSYGNGRDRQWGASSHADPPRHSEGGRDRAGSVRDGSSGRERSEAQREGQTGSLGPWRDQPRRKSWGPERPRAALPPASTQHQRGEADEGWEGGEARGKGQGQREWERGGSGQEQGTRDRQGARRQAPGAGEQGGEGRRPPTYLYSPCIRPLPSGRGGQDRGPPGGSHGQREGGREESREQERDRPERGTDWRSDGSRGGQEGKVGRGSHAEGDGWASRGEREKELDDPGAPAAANGVHAKGPGSSEPGSSAAAPPHFKGGSRGWQTAQGHQGRRPGYVRGREAGTGAKDSSGWSPGRRPRGGPAGWDEGAVREQRGGEDGEGREGRGWQRRGGGGEGREGRGWQRGDGDGEGREGRGWQRRGGDGEGTCLPSRDDCGSGEGGRNGGQRSPAVPPPAPSLPTPSGPDAAQQPSHAPGEEKCSLGHALGPPGGEASRSERLIRDEHGLPHKPCSSLALLGSVADAVACVTASQAVHGSPTEPAMSADTSGQPGCKEAGGPRRQQAPKYIIGRQPPQPHERSGSGLTLRHGEGEERGNEDVARAPRHREREEREERGWGREQEREREEGPGCVGGGKEGAGREREKDEGSCWGVGKEGQGRDREREREGGQRWRYGKEEQGREREREREEGPRWGGGKEGQGRDKERERGWEAGSRGRQNAGGEARRGYGGGGEADGSRASLLQGAARVPYDEGGRPAKRARE
ncbi:hypothetical protein QJQ45_000451 [Haematococcus lacustris]|nr:hypothetical protein QJQ45_000451 [Haematococcus lacustris]